MSIRMIIVDIGQITKHNFRDMELLSAYTDRNVTATNITVQTSEQNTKCALHVSATMQTHCDHGKRTSTVYKVLNWLLTKPTHSIDYDLHATFDTVRYSNDGEHYDAGISYSLLLVHCEYRNWSNRYLFVELCNAFWPRDQGYGIDIVEGARSFCWRCCLQVRYYRRLQLCNSLFGIPIASRNVYRDTTNAFSYKHGVLCFIQLLVSPCFTIVIIFHFRHANDISQLCSILV